ncbi:hypothetical protein JOC86_001023 [Bacillus pakistanensis]|uniref:Uncharacterized protein n=1 Tax=Rossellomorea pakistanensis TaxID=992288 RepID=A0ABS2NA81_9BACI|nr:hypothetical protein [Bacillus pakistanensis]
MNVFIAKLIAPEAKKVRLNSFEGIGNHQRWDTVIKRIFEHRKLVVVIKENRFFMHRAILSNIRINK